MTDRTRLLGLVTAVVGMLGVPGAAGAATRYAEPNGDGPEPCVESDPCALADAVATFTEEVIVMPGDYQLGNGFIDIHSNVHGVAGQPRPRIIASTPSSGYAVSVEGGPSTVVRWLSIEASDALAALELRRGTVEQVVAKMTTGGGPYYPGACVHTGDFTSTLRDSICWNAASEGSGFLFAATSGTGATVDLRNVTAAGGGFGIAAFSSGGPSAGISGKGVIAAAPVDVVADSDLSAGAFVNLESSNFDTSSGVGGGTVTAPGSSGNQIAPPVFADAANGDFHQLAGSPTIDAGVADILTGPGDLDGDPRIQGAAIDIGADEFTPSIGPGGDTDPPETTITKRPKKRTAKRKVKFNFTSDEPGSTFECQLDKREFAPCTPPFKKRKVKAGKKHTFAVRALDPAGNLDPTPAKARWKVVSAGG